ncbi:hypothetical protein ID853_18045 [Xenorhabdus sp. Vera]|nr:hypothetical protein [Xenorhabdus sp. Vera]MBD2812721.1 hypothetical protein [Xenorhabdus sp. Vera]
MTTPHTLFVFTKTDVQLPVPLCFNVPMTAYRIRDKVGGLSPWLVM